ncbi:MAG: leucine-rich repeat domain-containing protein, partial [Bacteroidaceae bacterium]|nr:leucine-rich repeat domain-containing protein [Bacteroidaceae bacterium]
GAFMNCSKLSELVIGDNVRTIGYRAFANCVDLEEVVIPDKVTTLERKNTVYEEAETFSGCTGLTSVTLGKRMTTMGTGVFTGCANIANVTIKDGCALVGEQCFKDSEKIQAIYVYCTDVPAASANSFKNYNATLYVPAESMNEYKAHEVWSKFLSIEDVWATGIGNIDASKEKEGKFLEKGRIVIVRNGKKYDLSGAAVE